jgi:hypothetical protein
VTIGLPSSPTAMLVYMPTSGPASATPPRIVAPGISTGPSGTPSTHSQVVSRIRPSRSTRATTRSPCDCAYAETHAVPVGVPAMSLYGPIRPGGMSSEHTQNPSIQNATSPSVQNPSQSSTVSQAWSLGLLLQLQPGDSEAIMAIPSHSPSVGATRTANRPRRWSVRRRIISAAPVRRMSKIVPARGPPVASQLQPDSPAWPWNAMTR